ncbi:AraC family transcriptional regulator [Candidatus Endobugula sertula]|uniref:AraC family transcriptional regulator n=1 Tax=Candidatus Endobugula sertula TaxID=62101 RepID=A0A1D2QSE0_9GAMM|nr:AraC family transcriptional regulator [Candidatus Endobugula sertula]
MVSTSNSNVVTNMDIGFKDLEDLRTRARIPVMEGTAGNVVRILQQRIGCQSLSISSVAKDLQLSKRTLQRHLQQQMVSYALLRDRVRFNRAFDCLLVENMSIEETSKHLDFSDRTSFTNAFKRWANLSPSVFRKLYRDYV